jgi:hypothetical protein
MHTGKLKKRYCLNRFQEERLNMKRIIIQILIYLYLFLILNILNARDVKREENRTHILTTIDSIFITSELLGRPTDRSVTINILASTDLEVYVKYGTMSEIYTNQTAAKIYKGKEPIEVVIDNLQSNTRYYYCMCYRQPGETEFICRDEHSFYTQRSKSNTFTFVVHADPHLDQQSNPNLYKRTLQNTLMDQPDFMIDLGDNFMSDKIPEIYPDKTITYEEIMNRHLLFRDYYDLICHSVPLFLVIGNHEGEQGWNLDGTSENIAVWTTTARKRYFPNPFPDDFYTGDTTQFEYVGIRENYYAWEWGDALFIVLDPYWYTTVKPGKTKNNWDWTLGHRQYNWFETILRESDAIFKFVFCHHLIGGGESGRGGIEFAKYYEWGGYNSDESWGFAEKRSDWVKPIHQLMVDNDVTVFFHGHDHFFVKQDLDNIIYQLVPQPSHPNYKNAGQADRYGYVNGAILPNSGHLRVIVSNSTVTVDYIRAYVPEDENPGDGRINGQVDHTYTINVKNASGPSIKRQTLFPDKPNLEQNYPNPFNPKTIISFSIPHPERVTLKIYNIRGENITILADKYLSSGSYHYQWQPVDQPSGVYFYSLKAGLFRQIKKMIYLQ